MHRSPWTLVTALGFALVALLLVAPTLGVFQSSFYDASGERLSLGNYAELFGNGYYREALLNSVLVSLAGTLGACLLGVPLALLTTRFAIPGKRLLKTLAVLSLLSPPFIGAYAWILILGNNGFLRHWLSALGIDAPTIYGPLGIALVFALQFYPLVFLLTASGLSTVDRSLDEAAESLGATGASKLFRVTLPLVLPSLSAGALMAFMLALANFGTPMILGETFRVLPTLAYNKFTSEVDENPGLAATLCIVLILVSTGAILLQRWLASRRKVVARLTHRARVERLEGWRHWLATAACYGIVGWSTFPLGVIATYSFRKTSGPVFQPGFDLGNYRTVFHVVPTAVSNSVAFSFAAVSLIVVIGTLLGYVVSRQRSAATRVLDPLLMTAYTIPGIVLGIGFVMTFSRLPLPLLDLVHGFSCSPLPAPHYQYPVPPPGMTDAALRP